jgi:hypothetical protein
MEEEVKAGIEKFKAECSRILQGVHLVVPIRPTGGAFLVSFTHDGIRTYGTIHEDDFADWGEGQNLEAMKTCAKESIQKLLNEPKKASTL